MRLKLEEGMKGFPRATGLVLIEEDRAYGLNDESYWMRQNDRGTINIAGTVHKLFPNVCLWPRGQNRIWPPAYLGNAGLGVVSSTAGARLESQLHGHLSRWAYSISDKPEEFDGGKCLVLTGTYEETLSVGDVTEKVKVRDRLWLDLQRGLALRKRETSSRFEGRVTRILNSDFQEIAPGFWLPKSSEIQDLAPAAGAEYPEGCRGQSVLTTRIHLARCTVNDVPDLLFKAVIRPGDHVQDALRGYPPESYVAPEQQ